MKRFIKTNLLVGTLLLGGFLSAPGIQFQVLHTFLADHSEGDTPAGSLVLTNGYIYGNAMNGGSNYVNGYSGPGVLFRLETNGANFRVLHHFGTQTNANGATNYDGSEPVGTLLLDGDSIYGATSFGGLYGDGTTYAVGLDGSNYRGLCDFLDYHRGNNPSGGVVFNSNGWLLGNCVLNGDGLLQYDGYVNPHNPGLEFTAKGVGTLYEVSPNADQYSFNNPSQFSDLVTFQDFIPNSSDPIWGPLFEPALITVNGNRVCVGVSGQLSPLLTGITGFTWFGKGYGKIYAVELANVALPWHTFTGGADGAYPSGTLLPVSGDGTNYEFYGVTCGSAVLNGTLFACGGQSDFTVLHTFSLDDPIDGCGPVGRLVQHGSLLYGVTLGGGKNNAGVIYEINTNGTGYKVVHHFDPATEGSAPKAGLAMEGNVLYGTTTSGGFDTNGVTGWGTVFKLDLAPQPPVLTNLLVVKFLDTNQVLYFTNISMCTTGIQVAVTNVYTVTNSMNGNIGFWTNVSFQTIYNQYPCSTNILVVTNQMRLMQTENDLAVTWKTTDELTFTLGETHDLLTPTPQWSPVEPNWTNAMDTNNVGFIIHPSGNQGSVFYRLGEAFK